MAEETNRENGPVRIIEPAAMRDYRWPDEGDKGGAGDGMETDAAGNI